MRRIELLLLERLSLEGICRVMEIKAHPHYRYMQQLYKEIPSDLNCSVRQSTKLTRHCLECESDELWSFAGWKANKQWIGVAQDRHSHRIVAVYVGTRGATGAWGLLQAIPLAYRQHAIFHTDDWDAYNQIIPRQQHQVVNTNNARITLSVVSVRCANGLPG